MKKGIKKWCLCVLSLYSVCAFSAGNHAGGHGEQTPDGGSFGQPGNPAQVSRTLEIKMDDTLGFIPSSIQVKQGETIRFVVKNSGKLQHELVMGRMTDLKAHREMMREMPDMKHDDPHMIALAPGEQGTLLWHFNRAGTVDFACLIADHMELGMVGRMVIQK